MSVENLKFWYDKDGNKVFGEVNGKKQIYNKCFEYLMSNNPDEVLSKKGIKIRKIFHPVFTKLLPLTTKNKLEVVKRAPIPTERPVIFALSHGFRDDIALGLKTIGKHAYLAYASLPDFYYSIDGLALWANGVYIIDRKDKKSKQALIPKIVKAHELGQRYHAICVEGVWNKDPNKIVLDLWKGFYVAARKINALVMPVAMINKDMDIDKDKDKTCYSSLGEAVDLIKYADDITLEKMGDIVTKPVDKSQIIEIARNIHDAVDSYEKRALAELGQFIDYEKHEKDDVLSKLRSFGFCLFAFCNAESLLKYIDEPELYCDPEILEKTEDILSEMGISKFETVEHLRKLMDVSQMNAIETTEYLNTIWEIVEEADKEAIDYFRDILALDKLDLMKEYSVSKREKIGDAEEYWDAYVSELISTSNGLYDYSIENSAEFIDKTKVTEAEVFAPMQNAKLIQKTVMIDAEYFDDYVESFVVTSDGLYNPMCNYENGMNSGYGEPKRIIKLLPENPWVKTKVYKKKREYFE